MFRIEVTETTSSVNGGLLRIGTFEELFELVLEFWSPEDYRRQWRDALQRLLEGASSSALITSVTDPASSNFLFWWPAYRIGNEVVFQNQVLMLDDFAEPFDLDRYYDFVPPRETVTEDGEPISEWRVSLDDIERFLEADET